MQRVFLCLAVMLGLAARAVAQDTPRVILGADYSLSPANGTAKDIADAFGATLTGLNQAYSPSVTVRLFGPVGVGLRQGIQKTKYADGFATYQSRAFDISVSAELSKRSDVSVLL